MENHIKNVLIADFESEGARAAFLEKMGICKKGWVE